MPEKHCSGIVITTAMIKRKLNIDDDHEKAPKDKNFLKKFSPVKGVPTISERKAALQLKNIAVK